jgi:tetratricopeptide (TPR) repeat protein
MFVRRMLLSLALLLGLATSASAQFGAPSLGKIIVQIREAGGARISMPAWVRLYSDVDMYERTSKGMENERVIFEEVPIGEYHVEVRAAGYKTAISDASLLQANSIAYVFVDLRLESGPNSPTAASSKSGPPVMAPKARKEFELAGTALRANDLKKAQAHLDLVKKLSPNHPEVHYLQGLIYSQEQNNTAARASLETAINLYPQHAGALASLGVTLYHLEDLTGAVAALNKAVEISPQSWQSHRALVICHIRLHAYDKALAHAERAIDTAGDKSPELHVLLARVLIALNQKDKARSELQAFLSGNPGHPEAAAAQRLLSNLLGELNAPKSAMPEAGPGPFTGNTASMDAAVATVRVNAELPEVRSGPGRWAPPALDDTPPLLQKDTSCRLTEVLTGTGKRAVALVDSLERVSATENVEQTDLDADGNHIQFRTNVFSYLVSIIETRPGNLSVEEMREAVNRGAPKPKYLTNGLGAMALIFHPYYVKDYEMRCEGLTEIQGQAAWSVYFKQRPDKPSRIRSYTLREGSFTVPLKGRAWIAANNFQVLRIETELVEPVKGLRLENEHITIEYKPVDFKTRKVRLWLPANAEMYAFFRGHRFLHHHSFADYKVFSVDVSSKTSEEKKP